MIWAPIRSPNNSSTHEVKGSGLANTNKTSITTLPKTNSQSRIQGIGTLESRRLRTWILNLYVLPLAIVRINCIIVRVIEPQRLGVVLRNGIFKGTYLI